MNEETLTDEGRNFFGTASGTEGNLNSISDYDNYQAKKKNPFTNTHSGSFG